MRRVTFAGSAIVLLLLSLAAVTIADARSPSHPSTRSSVEESWRVTLTHTTFTEEGSEGTVFIATAINSGPEEQVLYTLGLVPPVLVPADRRYDTWGIGPPARLGKESARDYVHLRPGEGFSRTTVIRGDIRNARPRKKSVMAWLRVYERGFEGRMGRVAKVIYARPYEVPAPGQDK